MKKLSYRKAMAELFEELYDIATEYQEIFQATDKEAYDFAAKVHLNLMLKMFGVDLEKSIKQRLESEIQGKQHTPQEYPYYRDAPSYSPFFGYMLSVIDKDIERRLQEEGYSTEWKKLPLSEQENDKDRILYQNRFDELKREYTIDKVAPLMRIAEIRQLSGIGKKTFQKIITFFRSYGLEIS